MGKRVYPAQELIPRAFEVFQAIATGPLLQTYLRTNGPAIATPNGHQATMILDANSMRRDCVGIAKALMDECFDQSSQELTLSGRIFWADESDESE